MPTIAEVLAQSSLRLKAITDTPRLDAEILLSRAMDVPRARLLANLKEQVSTEDFEPMLQRRLNSEPIARAAAPAKLLLAEVISTGT